MARIIKEIKSCPFCGRIWLYIDTHPDNHFSIRCRCGATGPIEKSKIDAINSWNIRDQHLLWNPFRLLIRFPKGTYSVDFKGNLESLDLATILQMLSTSRKTGILQMINNYTKSVICLKDGNIVAASDSNGLRLGQILYKHGMISHKRLKEALQLSKKSHRMLGEILLSLRYIDINTLKEVVHQQVQEAVLELFFWKEGYFEYRDCIIEFDEDGAQEINTMEIIMESARRMDEWDELKRRKEKQRQKKSSQVAKEKVVSNTVQKPANINPPRIAEIARKKKLANNPKKKKSPPRIIPYSEKISG